MVSLNYQQKLKLFFIIYLFPLNACHGRWRSRSEIADRMTMKDDYRWDKVLKNGPVKFYTSKICGRQSLKNLKWYGHLSTPYRFKFFKGCLPQILLGLFLDTLSQVIFLLLISNRNIYLKRCHFWSLSCVSFYCIIRKWKRVGGNQGKLISR